MAKETFAVKLDSDLNTQLRDLQRDYKSGQEFAEALLLALKEQRINTDTDSPIKKEQIRVRKALADIERVVLATMELAVSDKLKAEETANQKITENYEKIFKLKETIQEHTILISELKEKTAEQFKQIRVLEQAAESVSFLKEAWAEKEQTLTKRITELDTEAQEARELKIQIQNLEKQLNKQEKKNIELRHQETIAVKKAEIKEYKTFQAEKDSMIAKYEDKIQILNEEIKKLLAKK